MSKKTEKPYTTEDLEKAIQVMKDEELSLTAPVEVTVEGDGDTYEIESLGHFHAIPNMTISLKLKNYVKKNGDHAFTLRDFLSLYNFREMVENKEDTQIVRIYTEFPSKYVEFGVSDWGYSNDKEGIVDLVITKKILNRAIRSFSYDNERDIFCVYLEEDE